MSLARAFTTRRAKVFGGDGEGKASKNGLAKGGSLRSKISAPVQLVSTTNMLSYNAPDIHPGRGPNISGPVELVYTTNALSYDAPDIQKEPKTAASESSMSISFRSEGDWEREHTHTAASSPPTSPDTAYPRGHDEGLGKSAAPTHDNNHLSSYFTLPSEALTADAPDVPSLPKRAPNLTSAPQQSLSPQNSMSDRHNRKISPSERLGKQPSLSNMSEHSARSVSTKASGPFSRASSSSVNTTASSQQSFGSYPTTKTSSQAPPPVPTALSVPHQKGQAAAAEPFGQELAQVTELAEEYATSAAEKSRRNAILEERELSERGLRKFSAEDYVTEVTSLFSAFFGEVRHAKSPAPQWI